MNKQYIIPLLALSLTIASIYLYKPQNQDKKKLQQISEHVNSVKTTWKSHPYPHLTSIDPKLIPHTHLGLLSQSFSEQIPIKNDIDPDLPLNFDSRQKWSHCLSIHDVRDQSNCGSCWAFAASTMISDRICIHTGEQIRISPHNLISCCSSCGDGCKGGFIQETIKYYVDVGIVSGYIYQDQNYCQAYQFPPCAHHVPPSLKYPKKCDGEVDTPKCIQQCDNKNDPYVLYKGEKAYKLASNEKAIMTEIYHNGPIEVAFTVYDDFLTYKSGVYQHITGDLTGGHAVKMIGWGVDEETNTPYWLLVNSWNESWGEDGFFKIIRGKNECDIELMAYAAIPAQEK